MRRLVPTAAIAAAALLLVTASASAATPTLTVQPTCSKSATGEQRYGVDISLTGLAPNAEFIGGLEFTYIDPPGSTTGGSVGPGTLTADANGSFAISWTEGTPTIFTATVVYQGQTLTKTVTVTCQPTTTADCKNGGWKTYGVFKNQGDCVSFVATGGKNPPANAP
jgi:hypothetical protein